MDQIFSLTAENRQAFAAACSQEHVYGSKIMTALAAFGSDFPGQAFFLAQQAQKNTALFVSGKVLLIASAEDFFAEDLPAWILARCLTEIDCRLPLCLRLQECLGGTVESSYFMEYNQASCPADAAGLSPTRDLKAVFSILQQSHEYYRTHLQFESWAAELSQKLALGLMELVILYQNGVPVATGSIVSQDETAAAIAAVAVIPAARHCGLGRRVSAYLTNRILQLGKKPVLISGYDEVAALYRQIGYTACGRWGELYL